MSEARAPQRHLRVARTRTAAVNAALLSGVLAARLREAAVALVLAVDDEAARVAARGVAPRGLGAALLLAALEGDAEGRAVAGHAGVGVVLVHAAHEGPCAAEARAHLLHAAQVLAEVEGAHLYMYGGAHRQTRNTEIIQEEHTDRHATPRSCTAQ